MIDIYALIDEIPEIKINSGRKPKQINNRYFNFFQRLDKKHIPSIIDDLIRGACTASYPGKEDNNKSNDVINSYIIKDCIFSLTSFSASNVQTLKSCNDLSYSYIMKIVYSLEGLMNRLDHHFNSVLDAIPETNVQWMDEFNCYVDLDTGEMGSSHRVFVDDEFTFDFEADAKAYREYKHKDHTPLAESQNNPYRGLEYLDKLKAAGLTDDEIINHLEGAKSAAIGSANGKKNNPELWDSNTTFKAATSGDIAESKHIPYISVEEENHQRMIKGLPRRNYRKEHLKMWGKKPKEKYKHGLEGKIMIRYLEY